MFDDAPEEDDNMSIYCSELKSPLEKSGPQETHHEAHLSLEKLPTPLNTVQPASCKAFFLLKFSSLIDIVDDMIDVDASSDCHSASLDKGKG